MKSKIYLLIFLLALQATIFSAEQPVGPVEKAQAALQKLKEQSDNPKVSNDSEWLSYMSKTELVRRQSIRDLKASDETGLAAVRQESKTAKGEYKQMLIIALVNSPVIFSVQISAFWSVKQFEKSFIQLGICPELHKSPPPN